MPDTQTSPDPLRPAFHFLPPKNWMNDPNGMIHWKGQYHLFYQHNPFGAIWGNMHWGHAVSPDLVHWRHLPIAIAPTPGGPDKDGIFSGCVVDNGGVPTAIYTGVRPQCQCVATGDPDLITWTKHPANPVIPAPPAGVPVGCFRDPCVWREGGIWFMVVGAATDARQGLILLYRSPDLVHWDYIGPLCSGRQAETGHMGECPFFFPLGGKHVLIFSPMPHGRALYMSGTYTDYRFTPEVSGAVDPSTGEFYAPHVMQDATGRRILMAWLLEGRPREAQVAAGWSGVQSVPRMLSLLPDGRLAQEPVPELQSLRGRHYRVSGVELKSPEWTVKSELGGAQLEVRARLTALDGQPVGLRLRRTPDGQEETVITYDRWLGILTIDRQRSSLDAATKRGPRDLPLRLLPGEPLDLRVFIDRSVVEIFANGGQSLTARIYPTRTDALGLEVFSNGPARVEELDVWEMAGIW